MCLLLPGEPCGPCHTPFVCLPACPDDLTEEEKLEPVKNLINDPRIRLLNRLYAKKRKVGVRGRSSSLPCWTNGCTPPRAAATCGYAVYMRPSWLQATCPFLEQCAAPLWAEVHALQRGLRSPHAAPSNTRLPRTRRSCSPRRLRPRRRLRSRSSCRTTGPWTSCCRSSRPPAVARSRTRAQRGTGEAGRGAGRCGLRRPLQRTALAGSLARVACPAGSACPGRGVRQCTCACVSGALALLGRPVRQTRRACTIRRGRTHHMLKTHPYGWLGHGACPWAGWAVCLWPRASQLTGSPHAPLLAPCSPPAAAAGKASPRRQSTRPSTRRTTARTCTATALPP